ncbi:ComEA family DNA-binding protein [Geothrix sp. PMB-07]|uniref:ComEA family DNA-binding protein n=1 Tax=Geothrix sp. PMB-07 TaxID=3068640 RepID=UPI00274114FC|nr:helix-hairpin-helix domain-containing protein [Geothrix sp. PMB-07]WLT32071.1 helix-hairpin-helix domain-containing protein [Geothrix sp. PMB-07]
MMSRFPIKPILVMATLLLASGHGLWAQESKQTEGLPKAAPQDAKPKKAAKETPASSKGSKATDKKPAKPKANYNVGEAPAPVKPAPKEAKPATRPRRPSAKPPMGQRVDINTASKEELMKLPGIFEAEANKIIAHRPYRSKAGLLVDAGLTGAQYFGIKDRVLAGGAVPPKK